MFHCFAALSKLSDAVKSQENLRNQGRQNLYHLLSFDKAKCYRVVSTWNKIVCKNKSGTVVLTNNNHNPVNGTHLQPYSLTTIQSDMYIC